MAAQEKVQENTRIIFPHKAPRKRRLRSERSKRQIRVLSTFLVLSLLGAGLIYIYFYFKGLPAEESDIPLMPIKIAIAGVALVTGIVAKFVERTRKEEIRKATDENRQMEPDA